MQTLFSCSNHRCDKRFSTSPWNLPGGPWRIPRGALEALWRFLWVPGGSLEVPAGSLAGPCKLSGDPRGFPQGAESALEVPGWSLEGPWITKCFVFQRI